MWCDSVASKKRRIGTLFDDEEYYHCKPFVSDTYFLPPFVVPDDHPSRLSARERNLSPYVRHSRRRSPFKADAA